MDGMPHSFQVQASPTVQRTLATSIFCQGIGLHSGRKVKLTMRPAHADHGIVFRRTDLAGTGPKDIPARYDHVSDTRLCTVLSHRERPELKVATVEHLLAALAGCGVHNALIEMDGPEVPIMDGSAADFVFLIGCAGVVEQHEKLARIDVLRTVRVEQGEAFAELRPSGSIGLEMAVSIEFPAAAIGRQAFTARFSPDMFRADLARARTFTLVQEVEALRRAGLALGGSLDNAVVVDGASVLNPSGLRMSDEFVRHKMLDAVGDLSLAGAELSGCLVAHRAGHALNNRLLHALFADDANWRLVTHQMDAHPIWQSVAA